MLVRLAPDITTVRALCRACEVRPSTLMSRFSRAGLPSPKSYLASVRLLHAAHLLEAPGRSIADVAYRLEYSSPQSFGRHVRAMLGITSLEFRRRFPFPAALARFLELMIAPVRRRLARLPSPGDRELGQRTLSGGPGASPALTAVLRRLAARP